MITIDTIRADHMACYGYFRDTTPNIDALALESIFFERCVAPISTTLPSHLSMMTGLNPLEHGVLDNRTNSGRRYGLSPEVVLLSEVFRGAGYTTAGFVSATPLKRSTGIHRGFDVYGQPSESRRIAGETNDDAIEWLNEKRQEPFFLWLHYYDPHDPYHAPPPFHKHFRAEGGLNQHMAERQYYSQKKQHVDRGPNADLSLARQLVNSYDGELLYTDDQVKRVLDEVRSLGLWDRTIVALIGDHGEGLTQHGIQGHGHLWHEQLHVPFMIRVPGRSSQRFSELVSVVDFAPTLLELIDLPGESEFLNQCTGTSALRPQYGPSPLLLVRAPPSRTQGLMSTLGGVSWKYVEVRSQSGLQLFHLDADPFELANVVDHHADVALEMASRLRQVRDKHEANSSRYHAATEPLSPSEAEELKSLGYVGDDEEADGIDGQGDDGDE